MRGCRETLKCLLVVLQEIFEHCGIHEDEVTSVKEQLEAYIVKADLDHLAHN